MQTQIKDVLFLINNKDLDKAKSVVESLIAKSPLDSDLLYLRALVASYRDEHALAELYFEQALKLNKKDLNIVLELSYVKIRLNKFDDVIDLLEKALKKDYKNLNILVRLSQAYVGKKDMGNAIKILEKILKFYPQNDYATYTLAIVYMYKQNFPLANDYALQTLSLNPQRDYMRIIIAEHKYMKKKLFLKAIQCLNEEIKLYPSSKSAYATLGCCYSELGQHELALSYSLKQIQINPKSKNSFNNYLMLKHYVESTTCQELIEVSKQFYEQYFKPLLLKSKVYEHRERKNKSGALRLGFVSGDLRNHSVFYWMRGLIEELSLLPDVEVYCFVNNVEDEQSEYLKRRVLWWENIAAVKDPEVAEMIHSLDLDILFDLSGHTGKNRLEVFLSKPAPIQITWLGQAGPTGLPQIDYMLADEYFVKEGEEGYYTEKVMKMPNYYASYSHSADDMVVEEPPYLKNSYITFGCFSCFMKVNEKTLETWASILEQVPASRLYLKNAAFTEEEWKKKYEQFFIQRGIEPERIILEKLSDYRKQYLQKYNEIDIALDTFPVGGATTTNDLLYMSVPLISIHGDRMTRRSSARMLDLVGCPELVAYSIDEYVDKAVELANDKGRIKAYKSTLREQYLNSSICDHKSFAQDFVAMCNSVIEERFPSESSEG